MEEELMLALPEFHNFVVVCRRGNTHVQIRIECDNVNKNKPGFIVDIYVHRRTQDLSISRIDSRDEKILRKVCGIVSSFKF